MPPRFKAMSEVQRLKNVAARGITDAWDALGGIVGDDASAYLEIFPVIFPPLDSLKIPDELDLKNPSKPVVLARYALEALYTGLVFSPLNGNQISRVEQSIEKHWQDIWAWCNFFFLRVIEAEISDSIHGDSEEELFQVRVFYTVAYVFNGLAKFENTRAMLKETRDFPRIIASMWLQAHKHYPRSVEATTKALYLLVPDQTDQSLVSSSVPEPWISAFVSTLHDHSSQLVDLFFSRITDLALGPEIRCIPLKLELPLLINSITLSPELTRAILARGAIRTVTFMMSRLASRRERFHVQQMNNATDCLHIGARFLCTHLREGPRWIVQALEGRLILTVFRTGGFTRCNETAGLHRVSKLDEDFGELLTIITPYIVYPSILRLVEKAIRTYRSRCLHTDSVPSAFLRDAWDELVNRAENEREIMTLARYMGHVSFVLQICANKECPNKNETGEAKVMRCSRCRNAFFCSVECQTVCWNSGHREDCKNIVAHLKAGQVAPITAYDRSFIYSHVVNRFKRSASQTRFGEPVPSPEVAKFDLLTPRPTMTQVSPEQFAAFPEYDSELEAAKNGRVLLMSVVIPNGVEPLTLFGSIPIPER